MIEIFIQLLFVLWIWIRCKSSCNRWNSTNSHSVLRITPVEKHTASSFAFFCRVGKKRHFHTCHSITHSRPTLHSLITYSFNHFTSSSPALVPEPHLAGFLWEAPHYRRREQFGNGSSNMSLATSLLAQIQSTLEYPCVCLWVCFGEGGGGTKAE